MKLVISDNERQLDVLSDPDIRLLQDGLEMPLVARELTYAESADSDGRRRVRSKNQNAEGRIGLHISGTSDSHFWDRVDNVIELIESAHRNKGNIVYEPPGGTAVTYDLESITVTGLPQQGIELQNRRSDAEITFEARPYGRLAATQIISGGTLDGPIDYVTVENVPGQVVAFGDLELTEASSQTRDFVEIGVQADFDPTNPEPLFLTAGSMADAGGTLIGVTGSGGTATRPAGAYSNVGGTAYTIRANLSTTLSSIAKTDALPNAGLWKVRARVQVSTGQAVVRLAWRVGASAANREAFRKISRPGAWVDLDLGTIEIPAIEGAQTTELAIDAASSSGYPTFDVDSISLVPADRYLRLRGREVSQTISALIAADDFEGHSAGTLNGKTPPVTAGGNWTGAGDSDDFNVVSGGYVTRSAVSDSANTGRFMTAGTAVATGISVRTDLNIPSSSQPAFTGLVARYTDTSNYVLAVWQPQSFPNRLPGGGSVTVWRLLLRKRVSGTLTTIGTYDLPQNIWPGQHRLGLDINTDGEARVLYGSPGESDLRTLIKATDSVLATGGARQSGRYGFYHENTSSTANSVDFDNFTATGTPQALDEPVIHNDKVLSVTDNSAFAARPLSAWTAQSASSQEAWSSVIHANGTFVAVAPTAIMTSTDGETWTTRSPGSGQGVTYGNGTFVAVNGTASFTSTDAVTWTQGTVVGDFFGFPNQYDSITYGNDTFVATGYNAAERRFVVMRSPNGSTWTEGSNLGRHDSFRSVVSFGNSLFVAITDMTIYTSPDGITWTARSSPDPYFMRSVTYGNGLFVAVGLDIPGIRFRGVLTSPDGITWTGRAPIEPNDWRSVHFADGVFLAVAAGGVNRVMRSTDGITWRRSPAAQQNRWTSVTYGDGVWVAVASDGTNRVMTSTNIEGPTYKQRVPIIEGQYLMLDPATRNGQKSRIVVRARRDDIEEQFEDTGLTDDLTANLSVTPRVLLK